MIAAHIRLSELVRSSGCCWANDARLSIPFGRRDQFRCHYYHHHHRQRDSRSLIVHVGKFCVCVYSYQCAHVYRLRAVAVLHGCVFRGPPFIGIPLTHSICMPRECARVFAAGPLLMDGRNGHTTIAYGFVLFFFVCGVLLFCSVHPSVPRINIPHAVRAKYNLRGVRACRRPTSLSGWKIDLGQLANHLFKQLGSKVSGCPVGAVRFLKSGHFTGHCI